MRVILTILILLGCGSTLAQEPSYKRTSNWYFGTNSGISFTCDTLQVKTDGVIDAEEGCATMSDTSGNLLFYTNGEWVRNAQHQIMPNGDSLNGCWSSAQSSLIVPHLTNEDLYYLFTIDCGENLCVKGLQYSEIDMSLNGGLGDVTNKNVLIVAPTAEKVCATYDDTQSSVWVLTHDYIRDTFRAFHITSNGIDTNAVVSSIGFSRINGFFQAGQLKFSPDGKMVAMATWVDDGDPNLELFKFNQSTGVLTNVIQLTLPNRPYGVSFSPDSKKLYASTAAAPTGDRLYQFDLTNYNFNSISSSETIIYNATNSTIGSLQLSMNGRLYVSVGYKDSLDVIYYPNQLGVACGYVANDLYLEGGESFYGLPNFIESFFDNDPCPPLSVTERVKEISATLYPNPTTGVFTVQGATGTIEVYDLFGRKVTESRQKEIDLSRQPKGIYVVRASNGQKVTKLVLH